MKNYLMMFVITHKKSTFPDDKSYVPLLVGANKNKLCYDVYYKDNNGVNISDKNKSYCELTGLYWIWKNFKGAKNVGIVHYRRYFFKNPFKKSFKFILNENDIKKMLENNDIILSNKKYLIDGNVYNDYCRHHNIEDLNLCKDIILKKYPKFIASYNVVMERTYLYPYNMFIMPKKLFDEYCKWLFDILSEAEKRIDISKYDDYNSRVFGFLSERLFNVWVEYKKLKIKSVCVNNIESNILKEYIFNKIKFLLIPISKHKTVANIVKKIRNRKK